MDIVSGLDCETLKPCVCAHSARAITARRALEPPVEGPTELVMTWTNNFSDERKIGEGAFGDVFEGILADIVADLVNQRQARVAVKEAETRDQTPGRRERALCCRVKHPPRDTRSQYFPPPPHHLPSRLHQHERGRHARAIFCV